MHAQLRIDHRVHESVSPALLPYNSLGLSQVSVDAEILTTTVFNIQDYPHQCLQLERLLQQHTLFQILLSLLITMNVVCGLTMVQDVDVQFANTYVCSTS